MTQLSVAIIGAGNIAGGYDQNRLEGSHGIFSHAGAYHKSGKFALTTVFDVDRARASSFSRHWGIQHLAASLEDVCAQRHNVISVCTPDDTHYGIVKRLAVSRCCRTIFVEKPLATDLGQLEELVKLTGAAGIHLVVNYQRRYDSAHKALREQIRNHSQNLLSVSGLYMKGLHHIGVTMVDTLTFLCGYPDGVLAYNRLFNQEVQEFSYEFVLFYEGYTASVKAIDRENQAYNYHVFEIDFLFGDRRLTTVNNSGYVRETPVGNYAYAGVKMLDETRATLTETGYSMSMGDAVDYVHGVTSGSVEHTVNTPMDSYNNLIILKGITESFERGRKRMNFERTSWKK